MATIHQFPDRSHASREPSWWRQTITLGQTKAGQPIEVTQEELCSGCSILGVQGMGKSSLFEHIIYQQMALRPDECLIVIDPKGGDLLRNILARMPSHKVRQTYLLDLLDEEFPMSFNPFACQDPTVEKERRKVKNSVMRACRKLWPEVETQINFNLILPNLVEVLIEFPQLSIKQIERFLFAAPFRASSVRNLLDADTKDFWLQSYNRWSTAQQETRAEALVKRVRELLNDSVVKHILCQKETGSDVRKIDFREAITKGHIILINLPVDVPGFEYAAPVIGTFLLSAIYEATFSFADTAEDLRPGFTLIVDEFDNFATADYERFFGKGRAFKVKQFLAHQYRAQLDKGTGTTTKDATLTAHTIVSFRANPKDSRSEIADKFKGITRRPTNIHPYPLEQKRAWLEHEARPARMFYRHIRALEEASQGRTGNSKADEARKRLNSYLVACEEQEKRGDPKEEQAVLFAVASVLGFAQTRTEQRQNEQIAQQLEQEKCRHQHLKAQWAAERDAAIAGIKQTYTSQIAQLENKRAALAAEEEQLSRQLFTPQERKILAACDTVLHEDAPKILSFGKPRDEDGIVYGSPRSLDWYPIEEQVKALRRWLKEEHKYDSAWEKLTVPIPQLALPWHEYIALTKRRAPIKAKQSQREHVDGQLKSLENQIRYHSAIEQKVNPIHQHYEAKVAQLDRDLKHLERQVVSFEQIQEVDPQFKDEFAQMVDALIDQPIATDRAAVDITDTLEHLEQRQALVSIGAQVYEMQTIDLNSAYPKVSPVEFHRRERQIQAQTRNKYCRERSQVEREIYSLFAQEEEQEEEQKPKQPPKPNSGKGNRAGKTKDSRNQTHQEERAARDDDDLPYAPFDEY